MTKESLPWDGAEAAWTVAVSECQPLEWLDLWLLFPLVDDVSEEGNKTISWSQLIIFPIHPWKENKVSSWLCPVHGNSQCFLFRSECLSPLELVSNGNADTSFTAVRLPAHEWYVLDEAQWGWEGSLPRKRGSVVFLSLKNCFCPVSAVVDVQKWTSDPELHHVFSLQEV